MDSRIRIQRSSSRFNLGLYGAAIAIALGAAAIASTQVFVPHDTDQPVLVVAGARTIGPDRIAGLIEPPVQAAAPQPAIVAPVTEKAQAAPVKPEQVAVLPPKPLRRPCIECVAATTPVPVAAGQPTAPGPADEEYDVAAVDQDGPVPPLPVGPTAGEGAGPGLLVRSGQAVVAGSSQLVGAAWTLSGAAVGGLVHGVRELTF